MPGTNAVPHDAADVRPEGSTDRSAQPRPAPTAATRGSGYKIALGVVVFAVIAAGLKVFHVEDHLLTLVSWIRGAGWTGGCIFILAYVAATVLFVPGFILTLGAGFAYGVIVGSAVVSIAANIGAVLAFIIGRTLARNWVAARVRAHPRFAAMDRAVGGVGLKIVLLTRLSPILPFNLLNYAFGLTQVSLRDYVVGSLIGMLPGTVMYVYFGSLLTNLSQLAAGRPSDSSAQPFFYFGGLAVTVVLTAYVTRLAQRALSEATAEARAASIAGEGAHRQHAQ